MNTKTQLYFSSIVVLMVLLSFLFYAFLEMSAMLLFNDNNLSPHNYYIMAESVGLILIIFFLLRYKPAIYPALIFSSFTAGLLFHIYEIRSIYILIGSMYRLNEFEIIMVCLSGILIIVFYITIIYRKKFRQV